MNRRSLSLLLILLLLTGCAAASGETGAPPLSAARSGAAAFGGTQALAERLEDKAEQEQAAAEKARRLAAERAEAWARAEHIYSHRGASGYEVEHTFAAYDLAIEQGSHYIEQDLVTSADGTLYVSHDESAERITGVNRDYAGMTDGEIAQLRTANGEGIHSMEEVFDRYGDAVCYVVELKVGREQVERFVELVREKGMEERVIVQSFHPEALLEAEKLLPEAPKLWLCRDRSGLERALSEPSADIVCVKGSLMSEESCERVHEQGKRFCVYWTDGEEVQRAIALGADCYFTNYTDRAMELEREYR